MRINIEYPAKNNDIISFAAKELSRYLPCIALDSIVTINNYCDACSLNIRLATEDLSRQYQMKQTDNPALDDQYFIQIHDTHGVIAGGNERSVLLGVYHYLNQIGCRFLAPGSSCEILPSIADIEGLFCCKQNTASFRHRGVCIEGANSLENILDFVDWLPKLGYNCFFLQFKQPYTFMARWYRHELNPLLKPEEFSAETADEYTQIITRAMKKRGLMLHQAGHGWTGETIGFTSHDWKQSTRPLTRQEAGKVALLNGTRQLFHGVPMNTNLCYSDPDVIRDFTAQVTDYIRTHPGIDYLHVWLADEYNNICECENCQKTTPSDQYIDLLNIIDAELTRLGLPVKIVFLLYQELLWPPKQSRFQHPERFILMFAPISRTFESSYEPKDSYGEIPPYKRNHISLPVNLDENMVYLKAWQQVFAGDSFVYDYPLGRAHYGDFGYVHISRIISGDIKEIRSMGLNGYISCQELRASFPNALPNYVMGCTLFNSELSFEEVTSEYFQAAYGEDWKTVLAYLTTLSSLCSCDYFNGKGSRINETVAGNMESLIRLVNDFTSFLSLRKKSGKKDNLFWKQLDYHCEYSLQLGRALLFMAKGEQTKAQELWRAFLQTICSHEIEFQPCLDVYRITEVSSKYTGFQPKRDLINTL